MEEDTSISAVQSACRLFGRMKIAEQAEKKATKKFKADTVRQRHVQREVYGEQNYIKDTFLLK